MCIYTLCFFSHLLICKKNADPYWLIRAFESKKKFKNVHAIFDSIVKNASSRRWPYTLVQKNTVSLGQYYNRSPFMVYKQFLQHT